jgi:hypothetical protein
MKIKPQSNSSSNDVLLKKICIKLFDTYGYNFSDAQYDLDISSSEMIRIATIATIEKARAKM